MECPPPLARKPKQVKMSTDYLLHGQETKRLRLRAIEQQQDFDKWLPFFQSGRAMQHWSMDGLSPQEYAAEWYAKQAHRYKNNWGGLNAVIEKDSNQLVGHVGLLTQKVGKVIELEVAYSLLPEHWKKGYASEAAQFCVDYAFQRAWSDRLISLIKPKNVASIAVAKRIGMHLERAIVFQGVDAQLYRIKNND